MLWSVCPVLALTRYIHLLIPISVSLSEPLCYLYLIYVPLATLLSTIWFFVVHTPILYCLVVSCLPLFHLVFFCAVNCTVTLGFPYVSDKW